MALDTMTLDTLTHDEETSEQAFVDNSVKVTIRLRITPDDLRFAVNPDGANDDYVDHIGPQFADLLENRLQQIFKVENLDSFVQVDFMQNRFGMPAEEVVSSSQEIQSVCDQVVDSVKEELKEILANDSEFDWNDRYERELFVDTTTINQSKTAEPYVAYVAA